MSTHTDGARPSVGTGPSVGAGPPVRPAATAGAPPRPRRPSPSPSAADDTGDEADATPAPRDATPSDDESAARRNGSTGRSRRAADPGAGSAGTGQDWLQQEIARRVAAKGVSDTGRHARPAAAEDPPAAAEGSAVAEDPADDEDDARTPRAVPDRSGSFRARSGWMPDPYAPAGLREPRTGEGWPPSDDGTGPEPAFRLAGPAARPRPSTASPAGSASATDAGLGVARPDAAVPDAAAPDAAAPDGSAADAPAPEAAAPDGSAPDAAAADAAVPDVPGPEAAGPDPAAPGTAATSAAGDPAAAVAPPAPAAAKQWPPATGASGLPRRVPGAGWTLDRAALLGGGPDTDTETRPVPSTWLPAVRRALAADPDAPSSAHARRADLAGPPTTDLGSRVPAAADLEDDDFDDDVDEDLGDPAVERTEVIWRAPGLDDEPGTRDAVVTPPPEVAPSENPYTGVRPRRFAAAPTDPEPVEEAEAAADGPEGRRVRVVLSERRAVAQSVRPVVDVQDPGAVGTTLRNGLVTNQLFLAARVFGVALLGLGLLPALFAAFPSIGELSVLGLRVPWLLLGFLVYPFLFGLGWWYVNSAERVEQDFAEGVQER